MNRVRVKPADTGAALVNPGMGWVFHYYDNSFEKYGSRLAPHDTVDELPGLAVLYLRLAWAFLEPEEGVFDWSIFDAPTQRWLDRGLRVAYRITTSETGVAFATPEWVKNAGARGWYFDFGKGVADNGKCWEPDFDDPVYLRKLEQFMAVFAERYDGRPWIDFVDIGTLGVWGEGHTLGSTLINYGPETVIRHIDLHRKYFKRTLLAANDDFGGPEDSGPRWPVIEYALACGLTLRDDSILVQPSPRSYFHAQMAQPFWPVVPVILESEHYGMSRERRAWGDGEDYLHAVENYHASYASIHWWPREFLDENRELIRRMNLRLGYRLQVTQAEWPAKVKAGDAVTCACSLRNAGVAPCLPGGYLAFTLKDRNQGGIVGAWVDPDFNVRALFVGGPGKAPLVERSVVWRIPDGIPSGTYEVFVSVGDAAGTPMFQLPLENHDGRNRYRIGTVEVAG
jgi:hypothetical protein